MLDGLSQTFGNLSSVSPELTVIEGGDDDEASSNLPSDGPVLQLFNSDVPAESLGAGRFTALSQCNARWQQRFRYSR